MNIIRFNDVFEPGFLAYDGRKNWDLIRTSPLFLHEVEFQASLKRYLDEGQQMLIEREEPFPYNRFRLCLTLVDTPSKMKSEEHYLVDAIQGGFVVYYFVAKHDALDKQSTVRGGNIMMRFELRAGDSSSFGNIDMDNMVCWVVGMNRWLSKKEYISLIQSPGMRVSTYGISEKNKNDPEAILRDSVITSTALIGTFAMDVMTPTNHVVAVRPDQEGRSVQWVEQRTHYTLIHHGHPANRKEVAEGQDVVVDRSVELTRMAHGRRAHYRTLRHARFTYARGKTIFVRSAWIGPKEWREKGSKQIYKILDPVDPQ